MRRWVALIGLIVALVTMAAASSGAATSQIDPADYVGDWTADTSSQGPAASQIFAVAESDESTTLADSGTNSANFEDYCQSTNPDVPPVTYFTVQTTGSGLFGGCVSAKTGGHLYTWNTGQVWYAHYGAAKGEPVLKGDLVTSDNTHYAFTAHHPAVDFLTHVRYAEALGKASKHLVELTTVSGIGEFRLQSGASGDCVGRVFSVVSGSGALKVKSVKIDPPNTVELDKLVVKPVSEQDPNKASYQCEEGERVQHIAVEVAQADPTEQDACPVGATGSLRLLDGDGTHTTDGFQLEIPKCAVSLTFAAAKIKKGSKNKVAVAMTLNQQGY